MRRVGRKFVEGYEENVKKRVMSDTVSGLNMRSVTEMREGRPVTSQLFLFVKYYLSPVMVRQLITEYSYALYFRTST